jgi:serine/threonine protein phosphatase PrpC
VPTPFISQYSLSSDDEYLIIATDGVWDGASIEEIAEMLSSKKSKKVQAISNRVTNASLIGMANRELSDKITNIMVKFNIE